MTIYQRIQEVAKEKDISIRQLEMAMGFSNGTLRKWKDNVPTSKLTKVANYLSVDPTDLIFGPSPASKENKAVKNIIDSVGENLIKKLVQLDDIHKQRVSAYTDAQLEDQRRLNQPETLAAHQADPSHRITPNEAKEMADTLDNLINQYEEKKK